MGAEGSRDEEQGYETASARRCHGCLHRPAKHRPMEATMRESTRSVGFFCMAKEVDGG